MSNPITEILGQDCIILDCHINSKKRALELLSKLLAEQAHTITYQEILSSFVERENLGSTAIGHGIALPHSRLDELTSPIAAVVRLYEGIPYDDNNEDKETVDVLFGLIVPKESTQAHLNLLANVAKCFHDPTFSRNFREAKTAAEICQLFSTPAEIDAIK